MSKWVKRYFCAACRENISYGQMMCSHGTCPLCGASSDSTIVKCETLSARWVKDGAWWAFWFGHWEYKK